MKWDGPDSANSWLISLACSFINTMTFGMSRLSGILFVASIPRFKVGRKQASFPYTFAPFLRNISGPLAGYLGHKFGVRTITAVGALIAALGAGLCYFAESIDAVTLLWGAVFGLGFGLGSVLLPISINQYFDKHRATASGISYSGACLGSFILPPIVDILLNKYGLSETYLFLSGFILNCVPAALLLRKPSFKIYKKTLSDQNETEIRDIIYGPKTPSYTVGYDNNNPETSENNDSEVIVYPSVKENVSQNLTVLTDEERLKGLSIQTILSGYSIQLSPSEPLEIDQITENGNGRSQINFKHVNWDTICLSSNNCVYDKKSKKDNGFEKNVHYSSFQSEQNAPNFIKPCNIANIHKFHSKDDCEVAVVYSESYQNYSYETSAHEIHDINEIPNNNCQMELKSPHLENIDKEYPKLNESRPINLTCSDKSVKIPSHIFLEHSETAEYPSIKRQKVVEKKIYKRRTKFISALGSFSVILDPIFVLLVISNGIYASSFVCVITIIVDFSRDLHIEESYEKYILMLLSVGDIVGRLGLGWITDRGYMTTTTFAGLCFACQGLATAAIVWSNNFISLSTLVTLYGLAQAGLIVIFPVIIAKFIEHDKQTIAIPSSQFLSGPLCLAVSPLIGYFRDEIGSYNWIFYGIALLSAASSVSWIFVTWIEKRRKKN